MNIEQKNDLVMEYIIKLTNEIHIKYNWTFEQEKIDKAFNQFKDSDKDIETIFLEIDNIAKQAEDNIKTNLIRKDGKKIESIARIAKSFFGTTISDESIDRFILQNFDNLEKLNDKDFSIYCVKKMAKYRNYGVEVNHDVPQIIQSIFQIKKFIKIASNILSNESTLGEHSKSIIDGAFMGQNLVRTREFISFITKYIIIHKEMYKIEELFDKLSSVNLNELNDNDISKLYNNILIESLKEKLNLSDVNSNESKVQIANYIYKNYITEGYCFQGINGLYKQDVLKYGLTTEFSNNNADILKEIDEIFEKHGLEKIFLSKLEETADAPYYYLTDDMGTAYHYSYHNPEYFSYFVATGNNMTDAEYDKMAYYMKNYESCKNNLQKLCSNYLLDTEETKKVIECYDRLWNQIVVENKPNDIVMIQRKLVNCDNVSFDLNMGMNINEIVTKLLSSTHQTNIQYDKIPAEKIDVVDVPQLSKLYKKGEMTKEQTRKYIKLENGQKYFYDILIHADVVDYDCLTIDNTEKPTLETLGTIDDKSVDIIHCNSNLTNNPILSNGFSSYQDIEMMIAVNGIANSEDGKKLLKQAREKYSPKYMSDYYFHLCDLCCKIASDEKYDPQIRVSCIYRMAKDLYPKAMLMKQTNNYPQFVSEETKMYSYMDYRILKQFGTIEKIRNGKSGDNSSIETLTTFFKDKVSPNVDLQFSQEFNNQMERLNFSYREDKSKNQEQNIEQKSSNQQLNISKGTEVKSFSWTSKSETMIYSKIKQKNQMIKQQKAQQKQMNKSKVKTLTPSSQGGNGSKGYTNVVLLSLIVSFVAGALFMVMYMTLNK